MIQSSQCKAHLQILHFNDVYDIQPDQKQPKGGASYFASLIQTYRKYNIPSYTFFSGDAFSPSLLSTQYKGQNMIIPLNNMKIDLACMGNHDFDYPIKQVHKLKSLTNFPWLLSNVQNFYTKQRLQQTIQYQIIWKGGKKIGIFSLAQKQWMDTLIPQYKDTLQYIDWQQYTDYIIKQLKCQGCNLIVALTHMMRYNDIKLAQKFPQIDLILGGHDHLIFHSMINNSIIVKSGTNFKNFSSIQIYDRQKINQIKPNQNLKKYQKQYILANNRISVRITLVQCNHQLSQIQPHPIIQRYVEKIYDKLKKQQQKVACIFQQDIDLRFTSIRKRQNGYLQFLVSLYRHYTKSQCAIMNSGNFRADVYINKGPVTYGVLTNVIQDQIVVIKVPGHKLLRALQTCVSMFPNLSGRYSTFSGIQFTWDCSKSPFQRIIQQTVMINGKKLEKTRLYKVTCHAYISKGGDGFDCLSDCQIDHDHFHQNNYLLINDLLKGSLKLLSGYQQKYPGRIQWVENQLGQKIMKLTLPKPKNVKTIGKQDIVLVPLHNRGSLQSMDSTF